MKEYEDLFGNELRVGDKIAYATTWDRSPCLKTGVIIELKEREDYWNRRQKVITVDCPANSKTVTLEFSSRIIKLPADYELLTKERWD